MINSWHVPLFPSLPHGARRTEALWDWTTFLGLSCSSDSSGMTLGNWSSAKGKVNIVKTRHVMIRKLTLLGT